MQVWSMKSLWKIHRGANMDDSTVAATITRDAWSFRRGLEAKISGSQASDFTLRAKKIMAFRNQEYEILYRGTAIGQVRHAVNVYSHAPAELSIAHHMGYDLEYLTFPSTPAADAMLCYRTGSIHADWEFAF